MWEYRAEVRRVVDGDTLDLLVDLGFGVHLAVRCRVLGIDTPEIYGVRHDSEEYVEGLAASAAAKAWVYEHGAAGVRIRTEKATGKYGRWLAEIWPLGDGPSLADALVDGGHAVRKEYE